MTYYLLYTTFTKKVKELTRGRSPLTSLFCNRCECGSSSSYPHPPIQIPPAERREGGGVLSSSTTSCESGQQFEVGPETERLMIEQVLITEQTLLLVGGSGGSQAKEGAPPTSRSSSSSAPPAVSPPHNNNNTSLPRVGPDPSQEGSHHEKGQKSKGDGQEDNLGDDDDDDDDGGKRKRRRRPRACTVCGHLQSAFKKFHKPTNLAPKSAAHYGFFQ